MLDLHFPHCRRSRRRPTIIGKLLPWVAKLTGRYRTLNVSGGATQTTCKTNQTYKQTHSEFSFFLGKAAIQITNIHILPLLTPRLSPLIDDDFPRRYPSAPATTSKLPSFVTIFAFDQRTPSVGCEHGRSLSNFFRSHRSSVVTPRHLQKNRLNKHKHTEKILSAADTLFHMFR